MDVGCNDWMLVLVVTGDFPTGMLSHEYFFPFAFITASVIELLDIYLPEYITLFCPASE